MSHSSLQSLKIKAKLLQKAKKKSGKEFALKDAFSLLAKTANYNSWKEMKDSYEESDIFNPPKWCAQWKTWFSSREEALQHMKNEDYLIAYRKQFFICDSDYILALGIESSDSDLSLVGHDWTAPKDKKAWENLVEKIKRQHSKN
jgi:hypothetical protein